MPDRPNILLFITDDHAPWTLPCYGNSESIAPAFDRLATCGTVFDNAFTPTPVCSPGRACLLTGLTASQHGVHDWIAMHDPECQERDWLSGQRTLSEVLGQTGYRCGLSGKWHIGRDFECPRGYDWYYGFASQGGHEGITTYIKDGRAQVRRGNVTEYVTDAALGFLAEDDGRPFFLHVGYTDTHSPYIGQDPELVERFSEAAFSDIQPDEPHPHSWNEGFAEGAEITSDDARIRHANQYAAVADIGWHMSRILAHLERSGKARETIVIYTSDHGLSLGQNGFWGKGNGTRPLNMYDVSIRIPLMISGPAVPSGRRIDACVDHFDTFQSICEWAGIDRQALRQDITYPGRSYLSLIDGEDPEWDDTRFGEYGDLRMARTPTRKLVCRYPDGPHELFDLAKDPGEKVNLIDDATYADDIATLSARLEAFYTDHQDVVNSGLHVKHLPRHNTPQKPAQVISSEAWRDSIREQRGL